MNERHTFTVNKNCEIVVELNENVFKPTGTSEELVKAVSEQIEKPGKLLDLGCGSGVVGIALYKSGKVLSKLYASDVSKEATVLLKNNARKNNVKCDIREGNIYDPWSGEKFDYIIDDISGISEEIAKISPWFKKISCKSGADGTSLVIKAITDAPLYLVEGGKFFFPVLSLSNVKKIISHAHTVFQNVNRISYRTWSLPEDIKKHKYILEKLKNKGYVDYEEKFGLILWYTCVYVAYAPIKNYT